MFNREDCTNFINVLDLLAKKYKAFECIDATQDDYRTTNRGHLIYLFRSNRNALDFRFVAFRKMKKRSLTQPYVAFSVNHLLLIPVLNRGKEAFEVHIPGQAFLKPIENSAGFSAPCRFCGGPNCTVDDPTCDEGQAGGFEEDVKPNPCNIQSNRALTKSVRVKLPSRQFVFPEERTWPVNDPEHAMRALTFSTWPQNIAVRKRVQQRVKHDYPEIYDRFKGKKVVGNPRDPNLDLSSPVGTQVLPEHLQEQAHLKGYETATFFHSKKRNLDTDTLFVWALKNDPIACKWPQTEDEAQFWEYRGCFKKGADDFKATLKQIWVNYLFNLANRYNEVAFEADPIYFERYPYDEESYLFFFKERFQADAFKRAVARIVDLDDLSIFKTLPIRYHNDFIYRVEIPIDFIRFD